jgi:hypothetical protein
MRYSFKKKFQAATMRQRDTEINARPVIHRSDSVEAPGLMRGWVDGYAGRSRRLAAAKRSETLRRP